MEQRSLKKYIVITSIFKPSEAIEKFSALKDYHLIVVGDKKNVAGWQYNNCTFLNVDAQAALAPALATAIPYNNYGRKMIGYIYAMQQGADIIIDTDDDNIPYEDWGFPSFDGNFLTSKNDLGWVNIYHYFSKQPIWPRGLPLKNINDSRDKLQWQTDKQHQRIGIWQALADGDPDVDAIYRLTSNSPCIFHKKEPAVLEKGTVSPFNSQNTAILSELLPLFYLPSFVTFRFTDILRGIVAQPILWQHGYRIGFTEATVVQKRNEHDYLEDFESEVPMYLHTQKSLEAVCKSISTGSVTGNLYNAYEALLKIKVADKREIVLLKEWLKVF
jgi:hypothetical protein